MPIAPIYVLFGPSSSGKTSICNKLAELNPELKMLCVDQFLEDNELELFKRNFAKQYKDFSNHMTDSAIIHALHNTKCFFNNEVSLEYQNKATVFFKEIYDMWYKARRNKQVAERLYHTIIDSAANNLPTVIDIVSYRRLQLFLEQKKYTGPIYRIFIYCPWQIWHQRISARNKEALANQHYMELRVGLSVITQFKTMFSLKKSVSDLTLDYISYHSVTDELMLRFTEMLTYRYLSKYYKQKEHSILKTLYEKFLLCDEGQNGIPITANYRYDYLLDTSIHSVEQSAHLINTIIDY